jgi:hypothetical protein
MSAQRLVTTGALSSYHAVVGDFVGSAVEAASNRIASAFLVTDSPTCLLNMS